MLKRIKIRKRKAKKLIVIVYIFFIVAISEEILLWSVWKTCVSSEAVSGLHEADLELEDIPTIFFVDFLTVFAQISEFADAFLTLTVYEEPLLVTLRPATPRLPNLYLLSDLALKSTIFINVLAWFVNFALLKKFVNLVLSMEKSEIIVLINDERSVVE